MVENLRITGPIGLSGSVREALARQMISHRGDEFAKIFNRIARRLCPLFGSSREPLFFTTSGTGGVEAAIVNVINSGDPVLALVTGTFGARAATIARTYGAVVNTLDFAAGSAADPDRLRRALRTQPEVRVVLMTHCETSTGVLNPVASLARVVREESDALIIVDGVSSIGGVPFSAEEWGIDIVVTASQKALGAPPGLAMIVAGQRSDSYVDRSTTPRFYFDFRAARDAHTRRSTAFTPAIPCFFGLDASLDSIETETLPAVYQRHAGLAQLCREGIRELGLTPLASDDVGSPTVTAVVLPVGISATVVRSRLEREHKVYLSQGRGDLKERLLRIGHMGPVRESEIRQALQAIGAVLP